MFVLRVVAKAVFFFVVFCASMIIILVPSALVCMFPFFCVTTCGEEPVDVCCFLYWLKICYHFFLILGKRVLLSDELAFFFSSVVSLIVYNVSLKHVRAYKRPNTNLKPQHAQAHSICVHTLMFF